MKFILKLLKWLAIIVGGFIVLSVLTVCIYKFINPPVTPLMLMRVVEGAYEGNNVGIEKTWKPYNEISPHFFRAVIVAEDGKFLRHDGFDWKAIENAKKFNERMKGKKIRGASTISMQTAKNVFLPHSRNMVRKAFEAYFTVMIEAIWDKKRIIEVYANIVELGDGIYGVEAASQKYFNKPASALTKEEAALLAAVLPNPRRWSAGAPSDYIRRRAAAIQARMGGIALPK
jgi:monofunctional biosynthetic peptidoglycan transglycosylase